MLHDPCGTLHEPLIPITNKKSPWKFRSATRDPCPNCMLALYSGKWIVFDIRYSPPSKSIEQPPISRIEWPLLNEVSPGKLPLGDSLDWFKQWLSAVLIAWSDTFLPVGSPPKSAGETRISDEECGFLKGFFKDLATSSRDFGFDDLMRARKEAGARW